MTATSRHSREGGNPVSLITDNLDIWSSAIKAKSAARRGRGKGKKLDLYGIKKLRELILELAVRGLLVPQDPNDEPASELLKKIAAEKNKLLKEGQIKKQKLLPPIEEDEKPFDLPEGWEWVRLNEIGHDWGQKTPDSDFTYIDVGAINKEMGFVSEPSILNANTAPSRARKIVKKGTVIYSTVRPYLLNIAVINEQFEPEPIASTAFAIIHPFAGILASFIYRYLRSPTFISYVESCQTGIAYPAVNDKQFFSGLYPVAPLAEQHRIVSKVDELMALCDQLEQQTETSINAHKTLVQTLLGALTNASERDGFNQAWARIAEHFDILFTTEWSIDQLKQTILQLAVMGKLVPQNSNDEPASELLKKIADEKERLIKEKNIKKQKSLPPIGEDEKPFELPVGWEWVRFGSLINLISGQHLKPNEYSETQEDGMIPYLTGPAEFGTIHPEASRFTNERRAVAKAGNLLVTCKGSGVGKLNEANQDIFISRQLMAIQPILIGSSYSMILADSLNEHLRANIVGIAIPGISREDVTEAIVCLPPQLEQDRIAIKFNNLLQVCDTLKKQLNTAKITQLQLVDAMTEQALN